MDFIDDFIQEYKNNPCLWKADSAHFKNRTKRQEAYFKLIEVAGKHGEQYNIERTKQKINNLRCAFRHQLKKYIEFQKKGEKDESYCPKRRYFESLMFLRDEESQEKKSKRDIACTPQNGDDAKSKNNEQENTAADSQEGGTIVYSIKGPVVELSAPIATTIEVVKNSFNDKPNPVSSTPLKMMPAKDGPVITSVNVIEYDEEKSLYSAHETIELSPSMEKDAIETQIYEFEKESPIIQKKQTCRKRSPSLSSQVSNETELISTKTSKVDYTTMDFEKALSMACKTMNSNMDDNFTNFGKVIAHKLRSMESTQALYAEKIISDVLFQGQMKMLSPSSINRFLGIDNSGSFSEIQTYK